MKNDCSAIILAAGKSGRMGQIKFGLKMRDGKTFLEHLVRQFGEFGCREIVVVVNREGKQFLDRQSLELTENTRFVLNEHPEYGRFHSLKLGLEALWGKTWVFIHNADNPFAEKEVLEKLYRNREGNSLLKPVFQGKGGHPVLIPEWICKKITETDEAELRLDEFLRRFRQKRIEAGTEQILVNINTAEDYQNLIRTDPANKP